MFADCAFQPIDGLFEVDSGGILAKAQIYCEKNLSGPNYIGSKW
jgi:hypothetical protein